MNEIKREGKCTKDLQLFSLVVQLFNNFTGFSKYTYEDHRICTALEKTVNFGTNTIVNEINSKLQCTKDVQLFSLVVQLFNGCTAFSKYIYEDHRICTALEKTLHFATNIIVNEIKREGQCSRDVQLFSLVVQLFKNIYTITTEFVRLWKTCTFWYKHHCE